MTLVNKIDFRTESLSKEAILDFLQKNAQDHYVDLNLLVDLENYAIKLSEKALHFTAYNGNTLIGLSSCYFNNLNSKIGYISGISISKDYRRIGIGSQLVDKLTQYGKDTRFKQLQVKPDCKNTILIDFFQKNGFSIQGRHESRCLMSKTLSK